MSQYRVVGHTDEGGETLVCDADSEEEARAKFLALHPGAEVDAVKDAQAEE